MENHEQARRGHAAYEAPVLVPARVRFGAQERFGSDWAANIICSTCNIGT